MSARCIALLCATAAIAVAPARAQQQPLDFDALERTITDEMKATGVPGAAVAVVVDGRLVFAKGFGVTDLETRTPVTSATLFRIASTTKMLTAAALVTAAGQGRLALDAPVGRYVAALSPRLSRVTLHKLLSHTAGLRDGASFSGPGDDAALGAYVRTWTDAWLTADPGEIFSYSNLGYVLAAHVLEAATETPFADAMEDILFRPLGMRRTTLRPIMAMTYPLAQGHDIAAGDSVLAVVRPFADDARFWANGGVFTNVEDFSRFAIAFLNGGVIDDSVALAPAVIAALSAPYVDMPGGDATERPRHAYGLNVRDHRGVRVLQHGGARVGFGSLVRMIPERRFAVIILANRTNAVLVRTLEKATELVVPLLPASAPQVPTPMPMTVAEMRRYAGKYENAPDYLRLELLIDGDGLFLAQDGQPGRSAVVKIAQNTFRAGGQQFILVMGPGGQVRYMQIAGHALKRR